MCFRRSCPSGRRELGPRARCRSARPFAWSGGTASPRLEPDISSAPSQLSRPLAGGAGAMPGARRLRRAGEAWAVPSEWSMEVQASPGQLHLPDGGFGRHGWGRTGSPASAWPRGGRRKADAVLLECLPRRRRPRLRHVANEVVLTRRSVTRPVRGVDRGSSVRVLEKSQRARRPMDEVRLRVEVSEQLRGFRHRVRTVRVRRAC